MWDVGLKLPTQMPDLRSRCFCGAEIGNPSLRQPVYTSHQNLQATENTPGREPAVPELTRCANIKLNNGVSLQRRPERLVISRRTIFPPKVVRAHRQSRQANMPPLGGFVLKVASDAHRKS